ncbi:hypothetical protein K0651_06025 [Ornithinimicrobium sp. Arc0846-15]|nr:hypothetical protein [Ornithinimicrobium laminariae]
MVSIVEAYIDSLCSDLFQQRAKSADQMFKNLISDAEEASEHNWEARKNAFSKFHSISLSQCASWQTIASAIIVRNAIAHGLGSLTRRQKNKKDRGKVAGVFVNLQDDVLWVGDKSIDHLLTHTLAFVTDIDEQVRTGLRP